MCDIFGLIIKSFIFLYKLDNWAYLYVHVCDIYVYVVLLRYIEYDLDVLMR